MRYLKIFWGDFKRNLELYVTILSAIVISILGLFNIIEPTIISSATLVVLALVTYSLLRDRRTNQFPLTVSSSNEGNNRNLIEYISTNKVVVAKLIQYSGDMIKPVIVELLERGAKVELLLQYPSGALNEQQCGKIVAFQESITAEDFRNHHNLSVRYYREPASIKAVKLDDIYLSIGWYTYRNKDNIKDEPWLYGHNNAVISARAYHVEMHDLVATFDSQFQVLWNSANILTLDEIKTIIERRRKELKKAR